MGLGPWPWGQVSTCQVPPVSVLGPSASLSLPAMGQRVVQQSQVTAGVRGARLGPCFTLQCVYAAGLGQGCLWGSQTSAAAFVPGRARSQAPRGAEVQAGLVVSFTGSCPLLSPRQAVQAPTPPPWVEVPPGRPAPPAAKWLTPDAISTPALQPQPRCLRDKCSPGQVAGPGPRGGPYRGLGAAFVPGAELRAPGTR